MARRTATPRPAPDLPASKARSRMKISCRRGIALAYAAAGCAGEVLLGVTDTLANGRGGGCLRMRTTEPGPALGSTRKRPVVSSGPMKPFH